MALPLIFKKHNCRALDIQSDIYTSTDDYLINPDFPVEAYL